MENLISKWKNAQSSLKKDRSKSNLSSNAKNRYAFSSSSDSDSPRDQQKSNARNHNLIQGKQETTTGNSISHDVYSNRTNLVSPPKKSERQNAGSLQTPENENYPKHHYQSIKKNGTPGPANERSERKTAKNVSSTEPLNEVENTSKYTTHQPSKKGVPFLIDQASYKIMDIFKYNNDLSNQEKLQRVKKVIEDVVDSTSSKTEELESQINSLRQETKRMSLMSRSDTSSKIVSELEARLCESEREKVQYKKEKELLATQLSTLTKENELNSTNTELLQMLLKNQKILEENNAQLLSQIQDAKRREEQQQFIWQNEVSDLAEIFKMLKEQLTMNQE